MAKTENTKHPKTSAQPPEIHRNMKLEEPGRKAAGFKAVAQTFRHMAKETGFLRGMYTLTKMNQMTGFDCPGCAWPDPDDKRAFLFEYCENGAKAVAEEATLKRVDPAFFKKHSVEEMETWPDYEIGKSGRITHPMILREGKSHYEEITWQGAFNYIASELNNLDSPDEAIFYTSGRTSNEAAFLYQLFVREFGTNNLPDCSNMCHESSGSALSETVGIGKGSVTLEDLHEAEVILIAGQNPGTNHPRMMTALQNCKQNGGKIVAVNPLKETGLIHFKNPQSPKDMLLGGIDLADHYLQVRINGDLALAKAIMVYMLEAEDLAPGTVFDHGFIQDKTKGYEELIADLRKQDMQQLVQQCGISESEIREVAQLFVENKKIIICWAMGITQHKNGVQTIQEYVNLLLLRGSIGKPGAGTCPVRGHSNVQGDRTMGVWEKLTPEFSASIKKHIGFDPPQKDGYDVVNSIKAMHKEKAKVFFAMGGNFISATPDTEYTGEALRKCNLTVHVSTKLNRSHLVHGETAVILPCLGRTEADIQSSGEQFVSVENSMGVVHSSQGDLKPASSHLLSEPAIIAGLASTTLGTVSKVNWQELIENYDKTRDLIEKCIPGFDDYNRRVRKDGGFYLPNGAREGDFKTETGKAHFTVNPLPDHTLKPDEYVMFTIRSHDQYNTTIYGLDDRYRGIYNERRVVLMNIEDMNDALLSKGEAVDLVGEYNGEIRRAENFLVVPYDVPRRNVATYFPEANVLVPIDSVAAKSNTPTSKYVAIKIEKR